MGIRDLGNKGLNTVLVLSYFLRVPEVHDCVVGSRHLRRLLLYRAIFRGHFSVLAHCCELDDRYQASLRQHRSWSDGHCQRQCLGRLRNPDHAIASTVQVAETVQAKARNHGRLLFRRVVSKTRIDFHAQFLTCTKGLLCKCLSHGTHSRVFRHRPKL